jgi:hypothetical protein
VLKVTSQIKTLGSPYWCQPFADVCHLALPLLPGLPVLSCLPVLPGLLALPVLPVLPALSALSALPDLPFLLAPVATVELLLPKSIAMPVAFLLVKLRRGYGRRAEKRFLLE